LSIVHLHYVKSQKLLIDMTMHVSNCVFTFRTSLIQTYESLNVNVDVESSVYSIKCFFFVAFIRSRRGSGDLILLHVVHVCLHVRALYILHLNVTSCQHLQSNIISVCVLMHNGQKYIMHYKLWAECTINCM